MENQDTNGLSKPPHEGMFKPGQSGNPGGRPRGSISKFLRELGDLDELELTLVKTKDGKRGEPTTSVLSTDGRMTINQFISARLLQMSMNGDISAIKEVLNRTEGRVPQPINLGGQSDNPVKVVAYIPDNNRRKRPGVESSPLSIPPISDSTNNTDGPPF